MNKTITIQVDIPATQNSSFAARQSVTMIVNGIKSLINIDARYDANAMHAFTQGLHGAAGRYIFEVVVDNDDIDEAEEAEIMGSLTSAMPSTHKIVNFK